MHKKLSTNIAFTTVQPVKTDGSVKTQDKIAAKFCLLLEAHDIEKMAEARVEIILYINDSQLSHMTSCNIFIIWQSLKSRFATSLALHHKFFSAKKLEEESMESWIG